MYQVCKNFRNIWYRSDMIFWYYSYISYDSDLYKNILDTDLVLLIIFESALNTDLIQNTIRPYQIIAQKSSIGL